ncbi:MAG: YncE family protein [Treponema sp.]
MKKSVCIFAFILSFSAAVSAEIPIKKTSDIPLCGKKTGSVTVNMKTEGMCLAFGALWVTAPDNGRVFRIDTAAKKITGIISVKGMPIPIAATDSMVLAGCYRDGTITCIDPVSNSVSKTVSVPGGMPSSLIIVNKNIWIPSHGTGRICIFNSEPADTGTAVPVGDKPGFGILSGTDVWCPCYGGTKIVCIDTVSKNITASVDGGRSPVYAVLYDGSVWVANHSEGRITRINPETKTESVIRIPGTMLYGMAPLDGFLWVASTWEKNLFAVDPETNTVVKRIAVSGNPYQIIAVNKELWVSAVNSDIIEVVKP